MCEMRMLLTGDAVEKFRAEQGRFPAGLQELKLDSTSCPMTGLEYRYQAEDSAEFRLECLGGAHRGADFAYFYQKGFRDNYHGPALTGPEAKQAEERLQSLQRSWLAQRYGLLVAKILVVVTGVVAAVGFVMLRRRRARRF